MKEATGELNMTVVTVVAIAAVAAFFYAFIWPGIQANLKRQTNCSSAVNCTCPDGGDMCDCFYYDSENNNAYTPIQCPNNEA